MAKLYYQGHSSYRITASDGQVMYVDPYAGKGYEPPADIVLITHQHSDHNKIGIIKQKPGCTVITNKQAVMAKNFMHSPKKCVGYLILIDGVKIYASGDTSKTEQMKDFASLRLDYAILCCGGMATMGLEESAECAILIGARHNIPVHIKPGKLFDAKRTAKWKAPNPLILTPGDEIELVPYESESPEA